MIDSPTLQLTLAIGNICFAALMAVYIGRAAGQGGLRMWMWARLVTGATLLLAWHNGHPAVQWGAGGTPIGWIAGLALEVAAYCVVFELRHWQRLLLPTTALALLLPVAASSAGASANAMMTLGAALIASFAAGMGLILLRAHTGGSSLLQKLIGANELVFAVAMGLWAWTGWFEGPAGMLKATPWQNFALISSYLIMVVNGFGFLLLCKEKDDAQMEKLATVDFLTGLLNRRAFFERAESARMLAARLRKPIALMMLDIDHFKQLNDRFGHATGDEALALFAETARQVLREHDIMGRLGGEEFAIALPGTDPEGALQAAERLRVAVTEAPVVTSGAVYEMTVSIGVVLIDPNEELTAALARADRALYVAKSGGRNRVEVGMMLKRA